MDEKFDNNSLPEKEQPETSSSKPEETAGSELLKDIPEYTGEPLIVSSGEAAVSQKGRRSEGKGGLWGFIKAHRLYILSFFLPAAILFGAYAAFEVHPFGDMSVLVLDLNGQYVYYFEHLRDILHGSGSPFISWSRNLSGEIMGMFAYYLASPFTVIPMVLPRSMMTESLLIMQLCKVGTAGVTFHYYLRRSKGCSGNTCIIFALMYSLMGYMIVQLMNPMWLDGLIYLPLIVLGIEKIIDENRWLGFIIPLALMYMAHFYIGWMITFFSIIYFIYYYSAGKKAPFSTFKSFFRSGIKFAAGGVIAAACASWVLIPLYFSLKLGKFDFSKPSYEVSAQFDIFEFFKNFLPNVYDTCRPEGSPVIYCGTITFLLLPLFFLNEKVRFKEKAGLGAVLAAILASMYISTVDLAWHGFQVPNWLPYRYSFTFSFILLVMGAVTFERLEGITVKEIMGSAFGIAVYAFYINTLELKGVELFTSVWYAVIFTVVYAFMLRFIKLAGKKLRSSLCCALSVIICAELFVATFETMKAINEDVVYSKYSSYNRYITLGRETMQKIYDFDSFDESGFYRIEKNHHRTVNDAMAMKSYGISHSSSTLNAAPIQFLRRLGFSYGGHYIKYKGSTMVSDAVLGIKYILEKGDAENEGTPVPDNKTYSELVLINQDDVDKWAVYKNPNALPLAFMANSAVTDTNLGLDNPFANQNRLLSNLVSGEYTEYFKEITIDRIAPENAQKGSYGAHIKYTPIETGKNCHIEYLFTAPTNDMVYFYLPSSYERQVNLWLDKEFLDYYFEGGKMAIQTLGRFERGEEHSLIVTVTEEKNEVLFKEEQFYYLDEELFKGAVETLKDRGMKIEKWSEDHIKGTVTAGEDQILFTTISWEPGWTIKVDGIKIEPVKVCDALIGIPMEAGEHTVEMTFFPKGLSYGIVISFCGLISVITIAVLERQGSKRRKAA